jgi:tripartite-type tricarboxylate transporter receptor subunit TctC
MKLFFALLLILHSSISFSQYPAKSIRMLLAFPPGGPTDINARLFALRLGEQMGTTVQVENKPGAGGNIAATEAARAAADGYTLFYNTSAITIAPALYANVQYDPVKDFAPVALTATVPLVLVVNPALPAKTLQEFIAYARANPGRIAYGSSGTGTVTHLAAALFSAQMGLNVIHVPYKGSAPALIDVAGGQTQMMIDTISTVLPYARDNRLRPLGVAIQRRLPVLPDVPTLEEAASLPGFEMSAWQGLLVPAATPKDIIARLNAEVNKAVQNPDLRQKLAAGGSEPLGGTPEQYAAYIRSELQRWTKVVKDAGARAE